MSISLYNSLASQYQHIRRVNTVPMMNVISHHIEDQVINHGMPVDFYAGFEKFSQFPDQMKRYTRLGNVCRRVYVIGVPDVRPPAIPGIEYIPLDPTSPLAIEWFVLVDTPQFWTLLSTQEQDGRDEMTGRRRFDGVWTFDENVVDRATLLISQMMNKMYEPVGNRDYRAQNQHIAEINSSMIQKLENQQLRSHRYFVQSNTLSQVAQAMPKVSDSDQFIRSTVEMIYHLFGAIGVLVYLKSQDGQLSIVAGAGEVNANSGTVVNRESIATRTIDQKMPLLVPEMRNGFDRDPYLPTAQTLIAAPIIGAKGIHGAITLGGNQANIWSDNDVQLVAAIGSLLAVMLEAGNGDKGNGSALVGDSRELHTQMAYLMILQRRLRAEPISDNQRTVLDQVDQFAVTLAQAIGVPEKTIKHIINAKPNTQRALEDM